MRLGYSPGGNVVVTLSRRNLQTLLAKLDGHPPNSARTLYKDEGEATLIVVAEEDDEHYKSRGYSPGPVHPDTEAQVG